MKQRSNFAIAMMALVLSLVASQARATEIVVHDMLITGGAPDCGRIRAVGLMNKLNGASASIQAVDRASCAEGYTLTGNANISVSGTDSGTVVFTVFGTLTPMRGGHTITVNGCGQAPWSGGREAGVPRAVSTATVVAVNEMVQKIVCSLPSDCGGYQSSYRTNDCRPACEVVVPTGIHVGGGRSRFNLAVVLPARSYRYERRGRSYGEYNRRDSYRRYRR